MAILNATFSVLNPLRIGGFYKDEQLPIINDIMNRLKKEISSLVLPTTLYEENYDINFEVKTSKSKGIISDWFLCKINSKVDPNKHIDLLSPSDLEIFTKYNADPLKFCQEQLVDWLLYRIFDVVIAINLAYPGFLR